jgi:hypothetical protein
MPTYRVKLVSEVIRTAFVEVEGNNEEEAMDEAYEYDEKELDWAYAKTEYYVNSVEEK